MLGFLGLAGPVGGGIADGLHLLFGLWRFLVPAVMAAIGVGLIAGRPRQGAGRVVIGAVAVFFASLALFHLFTGALALLPSIEAVKARGGAVGALIAYPLRRLLGSWGAFVLLQR